MDKELSLYPNHFLLTRVALGRIVFGFILYSLVYSYFSHTLIHQLASPVIVFPYVDPTYWLAHMLRIPEFIAQHHAVAICFDLLLVCSCAVSALFPAKRLVVACFAILFFVYFLMFNTFGAHHIHAKVGMLLMPIPFLLKREQSFSFVWQSLRYFTLFVYSCAFCWKLFRFSFAFPGQGASIIRRDFAAYLYFHPNTYLAGLYRWLLQHPAFSAWLFIVGFLLEGCFITGFFTTRFDRFLFLASLVLVAGFYLMAGAFFVNLLILSIPLLCMPRHEMRLLISDIGHTKASEELFLNFSL